MYNEELKLKFIQQYTSSVNMIDVCMHLFARIEKYELAAGKDFCTMTREEMNDILCDVTGIRVHSKWQKVYILKAYEKWCVTNGVDGATLAISEADFSSVNKIRQQMVSSPRHLQIVLDKICAPEKYDTFDNMIRAHCWMAFAGMVEEDAVQVTVLDVDFSKMEINFNGESYPLYREAVPCLQKCLELTSIAHFESDDINERSYRPRFCGDILIRGSKCVPTAKSMRDTLSRRIRDASRSDTSHEITQISFTRILTSGTFYRLLEDERVGMKPNLTSYTIKMLEYRGHDLTELKQSKINQVNRYYEQDYEHWKFAFSI